MRVSGAQKQLIRDSRQVIQLVKGQGASAVSRMLFRAQMRLSQSGLSCVATSPAHAHNFNCIFLRGAGDIDKTRVVELLEQLGYSHRDTTSRFYSVHKSHGGYIHIPMSSFFHIKLTSFLH